MPRETPDALEEVLARLRPDPTAASAPYEQVRQGLAEAVADGRLPPGTRLPPVRALAERLGLAANTVARVYRELEADGVVRTEGRRGTTVGGAVPAHADLQAALSAYVGVARRRGLTLAQAVQQVEDGWRQD